MRRLGILLLVTCVAAGCSFTVGRMAAVSTRTADLQAGAGGKRTEGRSCVPVLFVFPVGPLPNLGNAVEQAIAAADGTILTDVVVRYRVFYVPPLFGNGCYVVEGMAS